MRLDFFSLEKGNKTDQREEGDNCPVFSDPGYWGSALDIVHPTKHKQTAAENIFICADNSRVSPWLGR